MNLFLLNLSPPHPPNGPPQPDERHQGGPENHQNDGREQAWGEERYRQSVKRLPRPMLEFKSFDTPHARAAPAGPSESVCGADGDDRGRRNLVCALRVTSRILW